LDRAIKVLAFFAEFVAGGGVLVPDLNFTSTACGTTVDVVIEEPFALQLEENPTTGYRWDLEVGQGLAVVSSDYILDGGVGIGGGGIRRFVLVARDTGEAAVRAKLWRQWIGEASVIRRCDLNVHAVQP
jgi:inhibitor of cysteine peptidase